MDTNCESCWKKIVGKPYSGKPNVRFDEGELEIGLSATTPVLYSTKRSVHFINKNLDYSITKKSRKVFIVVPTTFLDLYR
jgi:hypothetical protein